MPRIVRRPAPSMQVRSFDIAHLLAMRERQDKMSASGQWHDGDWLMGYIIPPFQRPVVWTESQMTRFIEAAWDGRDLGRYVFNDTMAVKGATRLGEQPTYHRTDRWLIDGQQRLTALDRYFSDQLPVRGFLWSELEQNDQRFFGGQMFPAGQVKLVDELELRREYDAMNYGGTPHAPEHRALLPEDEPVTAGPQLR